MAKYTNNMSLVKYDADDKVTPNGYDSNFDKIDEAITELRGDYIVAQGTQTTTTSDTNPNPLTWTYRKWDSGIAECWGSDVSGDYSIYVAWDGWYYSTLHRRPYPIEFIEPPVEQFTQNLVEISTGDPYTSVSGCFLSPTATQTGEYRVFRPNSKDGIKSYMRYYVIGRWK